MLEKREEYSFEFIKEINGIYHDSLKFNSKNHKTWHSYGMLNFVAVKMYEKQVP